MRGSLPLKVRIPGCEPIRRLSGTYDKVMRKKLVRMIHTLHEQGRDDLVNGIAKGTLRPLQVYNLWKFNRLEKLPYADDLRLFSEVWREWIAGWDRSDDWRVACEGYCRRIEALMKPDATMAALPEAIREYASRRTQYPRSVKVMRMAMQSLARKMLGRRHRIWLEITDIPIPRQKAVRKKHPLTANQLHDKVRELGDPCGPMAWTMATTGMHWKEYTGAWEREGNGLRIHGGKTKGRDRLIPLVSLLHPPIATIAYYRRRLARVGITPYDLRRTFAGLMVEAGIPRPRRKAYLGHSADDITAIYEQQEVREYLTRDAEKIRLVLGEPTDGPTLRLLIGEVK
jgi:integrase